MKSTSKLGKGKRRTVITLDPSLPDPEPKKETKPGGLHSIPEDYNSSPESAARRLGRPADSDRTPELLPFEATLSFAFRGAGGRQTAIEYARLAAGNDKRFERFCFAYDRLSSSDQGVIRLEDLCAAAEITPSEFLGGIVTVAYKHNTDVSRLVAAINQPRVVEATIEAALQPFGTDDRKILHTHSGFLPTPRAAQINVNATANAAAIAQGGSANGGGMPKFETDIIDVTEAVRGDASSRKVANSRQIAAVPERLSEIQEAEFEEVPVVPSS
jgi:hypothetical protein